MDPKPEIRVIREGNAVTISATGAMDLLNSDEFRAALMEAAGTSDDVTVDFRATQYIDTAILADLANGAKALRARGKRLKVLLAEPTHPLRALQITGFSAVVEMVVEPKTEQAT